MVNVNSFRNLPDNEAIEQAIANRDADGIVVIPPRVSDIEPERTHWLLDRAILLPENTTIVLQSCKIKLSDRCRDNFFRTANCGFGFPDPAPIKNVHIRGEGFCTLEGADHPRASGDGSKLLHKPCPHHPPTLSPLMPTGSPRNARNPENWTSGIFMTTLTVPMPATRTNPSTVTGGVSASSSPGPNDSPSPICTLWNPTAGAFPWRIVPTDSSKKSILMPGCTKKSTV